MVLGELRGDFREKFLAYSSQDGRVYVLTPPPNSEARKIKTFVNTVDKFNEFCLKTLGVNLRTLS